MKSFGKPFGGYLNWACWEECVHEEKIYREN